MPGGELSQGAQSGDKKREEKKIKIKGKICWRCLCMQDKGGRGGDGGGPWRGVRVRRRGDLIISNNKECHIKGKKKKKILKKIKKKKKKFCVLYEIRFGTKRHIDARDFLSI